jgi:hypothetical protein
MAALVLGHRTEAEVAPHRQADRMTVVREPSSATSISRQQPPHQARPASSMATVLPHSRTSRSRRSSARGPTHTGRSTYSSPGVGDGGQVSVEVIEHSPSSRARARPSSTGRRSGAAGPAGVPPSASALGRRGVDDVEVLSETGQWHTVRAAQQLRVQPDRRTAMNCWPPLGGVAGGAAAGRPGAQTPGRMRHERHRGAGFPSGCVQPSRRGQSAAAAAASDHARAGGGVGAGESWLDQVSSRDRGRRELGRLTRAQLIAVIDALAAQGYRVRHAAPAGKDVWIIEMPVP